MTFAAADLDQRRAMKVLLNDLRHVLKMRLKHGTQALLVVIVGVVIHQFGTKRLVGNQSGHGILSQHDITPRAVFCLFLGVEDPVLKNRKLLRAIYWFAGYHASIRYGA